jgi:membrane protein
VQRARGVVDRAVLRLERARADHPTVDIAVRTFRRYSEDDAGYSAAALTYYTFFSVFPIIIFAASLLGYLTFINQDLQQRLLQEGVEAVPLLSDIFDRDALEGLQQRSGQLALLGAVMALYAGSGAIVALQHALNRLHGFETEPGFLSKRIKSLKWLGVLALAGLVSVALGALASSAGRIFDESAPVGWLVAALVRAAGTLLNVGAFALAFMMLPAHPRGLKEVLPGAVAGGIGFELLKAVGGWYLASSASSRRATFGTFAAAAGLLVASYLLAQLTLLVAELNAVLAERRRTRQSSVNAEEES